MILIPFFFIRSTGSDSTQDYNIQKFDRNFGRSLLAGYSDHYLSDFALHGTSDDAYLGKLHSDLKVSVKVSWGPTNLWLTSLFWKFQKIWTKE